MKKLFSVLMVFALPALMVACAKKGGDNEVSGVGVSATCVHGGCNTNAFDTYYAADFGRYSTPAASFNGISGDKMAFCGCEAKYGSNVKTVYHNQWGFGCAETYRLSEAGGNLLHYYLSSGNSWGSTSQLGTVPTTYGVRQIQCDLSVAQACLVSESNPCGEGNTCRPANGSQIGLCVRN